ncbi:sulfate ABC transporter permease [Luteitalea sp. TBR-22]|uniref:ABC transporter permease n=1 Tax=Luteitalea sp. TBR-22 TaxID=2802971 RepID=UPI001AFAC774|nr:ABC transporter permease [Luteitalea sp. TBR-22]BCS32484.1 sulfate ABC transporter permease [Luteitalea sp. TBR-22]
MNNPSQTATLTAGSQSRPYPHSSRADRRSSGTEALAGRPGGPIAGLVSPATARRAVFFALLLVGWEALSRFGPWPDYLLPGPVAVGASLAEGIRSGVFVRGAASSLLRLVVGYGISLIGGVGLGLLLARFRGLRETLGTLMVGLQALPSVCWLPLAILWFGLSERAIVFVVVMGSLFSIVLGVRDGIANTPPVFVKAARNLGASGWRLYVEVVLPAAFPTVLAGLKQGWAFAWRSLMAAELLYYSLSLGNLLQTGRDLNDAARVMAVMVLIVAIGVAFNQWIFAPLERRVATRWGLGAAGA